jgi:hypothetical protein
MRRLKQIQLFVRDRLGRKQRQQRGPVERLNCQHGQQRQQPLPALFTVVPERKCH